MKPARDASFHRRRWHHRRRCRFTDHAEVEPAAAAVIPVAGQGHQRFLVAEQQTQEMGHLRLPDEASHCRGQPGSGNDPSIDSSHGFATETQPKRDDANPAASHHVAAASTVSNDGSVMLDATTSSRSALPVPHPNRRRRLPHCASCRFTCWCRVGQQHHQSKGRWIGSIVMLLSWHDLR
jgi:hypothetical protein